MPIRKFKKHFTEVRYKKLIEHMNEAVWMGDAQERTVYANPKFCELMGSPLEEMLGRKSYDFWDEESAQKVRNVNVDERKKGVSSSYEGNLLSKSGTKIPVLLSGTPLPDGGTIGIMTDLRELRKKEAVYKNLVEHMNEALWMGNENEITTYANPKLCELSGYSFEELVGRKSSLFWDEATLKKVEQANAHERKKGLSSTYEGILINKNGEKIPVLCNGSPLSGGGTFGVMTDLRELRKKEEDAHVLGNAIEHATDAIIVFGQENKKISAWNQGAKIIFAYKKKEILGASVFSIFPEKDLEPWLKPETTFQNVELEFSSEDHEPLTLSVTITPVASSYLLVARDITPQIRFEEELTLKYEKMKNAYNQFGILRRQMDYIFDTLQTVNDGQDLKELGNYFVNAVIMLTQVDACVLRLYNARRESLDLLSEFGMGIDWKGKASIKFPRSLAEKAFQKGLPLKVIDIVKEPRYSSKYLAKKKNFSSLLLIPLQFRKKPVGTLSLYVTSSKKLEIFENEFIEKYAHLIEVALSQFLLKS